MSAYREMFPGIDTSDFVVVQRGQWIEPADPATMAPRILKNETLLGMRDAACATVAHDISIRQSAQETPTQFVRRIVGAWLNEVAK